ncbi:3'-5' exonuclease [Vibrio antiquarius]|uniref:3'-5' exonuclease n=3 Tax=Vibrio TaxID=662 RepID=UPI001E45C126|nr:3'-5' exonuclease [Vibrio parahaemolyticus]MCR9684224.1 3'-5' exonuclease [Vibrio antiquarius]
MKSRVDSSWFWLLCLRKNEHKIMRAIDFYIEKIEGFEAMSFAERRESAAKANLIGKQHTKPTLKAIFRVKPSKEARSRYSYKNPYSSGKIECFTLRQCVPMRELSNKPRTEAQNAATKKLLMASPKGKAITWCKEAIGNGLIMIDTETTDLDGVVIQIAAVCCKTGETLYSSLVHTDREIAQEAQDIHGISASMLEGAPTPDEVSRDLEVVLKGREWTAFNLAFDRNAIERTFSGDWISATAERCAMRLAAKVYGATNRYGTISLSAAMERAGVEWKGQAHDAKADAKGAAELLKKISQIDL